MPIAEAVAYLLPEGELATPGKSGRGKAEYDWYYQLGPADRGKVRKAAMGGTLKPDQAAHAAGFDYVDEWADKLVSAITARRSQWESVSEYPDTMTLAPDALVGPVEIAAMCGVQVDTVYQWVTRGRLPAAWATVSGTRLWPRHVIEEWALETGRLAKWAAASDDF